MSEYRELSRLFSVKFLKKILLNQHNELIYEYTKSFKKLHKYVNSSDYRKLYNEAYKILLKNYRFEYIYKNELYTYIYNKYDIIGKNGIVTELRSGKNIADLVFFNGTSRAFEIKTEFDKNIRLTEQVESYSLLFKEVYIVTHEDNISKVQEIVPKRIGIIAFTEKNEFQEIREAESFNGNLRHKEMFNTLRRNEYENIIRNKLKTEITVDDDEIYKFCFNCFSEVPILEAHDLVISELKSRSSKVLTKRTKKWPKSIAFLIENSNFNQKDQEQLQNIFK